MSVAVSSPQGGGKVIAIIQPCFVPWLGYFEQIALADIFVYMDDVQYTKKDWRNNNQLKSPYGVKNIIVPVSNASRSIQINQALISYASNWEEVLLNQINEWYRKAPYFKEIMDLITPTIRRKHVRLVDLNYDLNKKILDYLDIKTPIYCSSSIERKSNNKNDRIVEICKNFPGVGTLFDGKKAQDFLDTDYFKEKGINVIFQNYQHRPYPQLWSDFVPYMSVLDLLFNCGKSGIDFIVSTMLEQKTREGSNA